MRTDWLPLWEEKRVTPPEVPPIQDWLLVCLVSLLASLEAYFRHDVAWRPAALAVAIGPALLLPWRRKRPLLVFAVAFAAIYAVSFAGLWRSISWEGLHSNAYVLLLPYALLRWGSGREGILGMLLVALAYSLVASLDSKGMEDAIGGGVVLALPAVLGTSARFRSHGRMREIEQAKLLEREQLAREMHDSVGHHISAIVIQAQAGRALAGTRPEAAAEALRVIEEAGKRSLAELRLMVRALRREGEAELSPQPGLAEIGRFADTAAGDGQGPRVDVRLSGELAGLKPSLESALYRLAQESLTNALRHARRATAIRIQVAGFPDQVRLTIRDDGESAAFANTGAPGFGLVGMAERVKLLGGILKAGPNPDRGWTVEAVLPKDGKAA
jgi:signal transduction histidine kinase